MMVLLLASMASAGSLGEGILGRPWGSQMRPEDVRDCNPLSDVKVKQLSVTACPGTLGDAVFVSNFMYFDNALYGALIIAEDKRSCEELKELSLIAWGAGVPANPLLTKTLDKWFWGYPQRNPEYTASFLWDGIRCNLVVSNTETTRMVDRLMKAAKADVAAGL